MADGERAGLRELVARGRAHYENGEYPEATACFTEVLREKAPYADVYDMLGVIYHQEGRLAEAEADVRRGAAHQPVVHRGGAEPRRHLQRPGEIRRGQGGLRAGDGDVEARAARAGPVRQGQDREHARRHRGRLPRGHAVRGGGPRIRAGAGAVPDVRRHPHRARQHPPRDGRPDGRDPRARTRARREPALRRRAPEAGARLLRGRAARRRRRRVARRAGADAHESRGEDVPRAARPGGRRRNK